MTNPELSPNIHDKHFDKNTNQHSRLIAEWIWDARIIRCAGKFSSFHNFLVQALIFYFTPCVKMRISAREACVRPHFHTS